MSTQRGRNAGVTGLIDIPGFAAKFECRLYGIKKRLTISSKQRIGRGTSGKWAGSRPLRAGGTFIAVGKIRLDGAPMPSAWRGQEGTVTRQFDAGKTETLPIRVEGMGDDYTEKSEDTADVVLTCAIISTPSYAGFATAPTATDPTKADQQQWDGTAFTHDTQGHQTSAMVVLDIWGNLSNTDAAEEARLIAACAAALPPMGNLKLRPATLVRDSDDGGSITFTWGLTDTEEDILNAVASVTNDPHGHTSTAITAAMNTTPAAASGLVARGTKVQELNDNKHLYTTEHGTRTTSDDGTFPRTKTSIDVSALEQENLVCTEFVTGFPPGDPSPPAGMVIADYFDVPDTNAASSNLSYRVYRLAFVSNTQRMTLPHYELATDPNDLDTTKRSGVIWDSAGSPPSDPGLPSGLKLLSRTDIAVPTHPTKRARVYRWAKNDSVDAIVLPHTWLMADPSNVISHGQVAAFNATPSVPGGYKSRGTKGIYQNGTDLLNVTDYALASEADEQTMPHTRGGGNWMEGERDVTATLATTAFSAATQAAAVLSANDSDLTFDSVAVEQIHDNLSRVVIARSENIVVVEFEMRTVGHVHVPARLSGTDVYVYLAHFRKVGQNSGGTAVYEGLIMPQRYLGVRMNFSVSRRVSGTTLPLNLGFVGDANMSAFLGLPANTVIYSGAGGRARVDTSGLAQGVSFMSYKFFYDSLGFFDLVDVREGYFQVAGAYGAFVSTRGAWRKATDLGFSPTLLNTGDFTGSYT